MSGAGSARPSSILPDCEKQRLVAALGYTAGYTNMLVVANAASKAGSRPPTLCSRGIQTALNAPRCQCTYRFRTAGSRTANALELPEINIGQSPSTQNCTMRPFG